MSRTDKDRPYLVKVYDLTDRKKQSRSVHHYHYRLSWQRGWTPENGGPTGECDLYDYSVRELLAARHDRRAAPWCTLWLDQGQGVWTRKKSESMKRLGRRIKRRNTRQWCHEARFNPELDGPFVERHMRGMKWWDW